LHDLMTARPNEKEISHGSHRAKPQAPEASALEGNRTLKLEPRRRS
jgi:hypothetical protein